MAVGTLNREIVERFWGVMGSNRWEGLRAVLHADFVLEYPQSGERIRGGDNFIDVNAEYPAAGRWQFDVRRIVADDGGAVSEVGVTDGAVVALVVSFFEMRDGLIWRMTEYWPDPMPALENRAHLVEMM